jgi:hypothetical protein
MGIGLVVGMIVAIVLNLAGVPISIFQGIFWGAVVGGFVAYWPRFADLGAIITRKPDEEQYNMVIGILALILFGAIIFFAILAGGWLLTRCFPEFQ